MAGQPPPIGSFCVTRAGFVRGSLGALCAAALGAPARAQAPGEKMHTRKIPSSGAALPVIGCGTRLGFDVREGAGERAPLAQALRVRVEAGAPAIDSPPIDGHSEALAGALPSAARCREKGLHG